MSTPKTPEERADAIHRAQKRAKKSYKTDVKKRRSVSEDEQIIITDCLVSLKLVGYSNSQCAMIVGLSRGQVKNITSDPQFQSRLRLLRTKLPQAAIQLGQAYLVETVQAVMHVIRTESKNELVLRAAAEMFDRFGIPKVTKTEAKVDVPSAGDPSEIPATIMDKLRAADPETQENIAALHESFVEGVERILAGGKDGPESDS